MRYLLFFLALSANAQVIARTVCGPGQPISQNTGVSQGEQVNSQTGTTYTFQNLDCGKLVTFSNGSSIAAGLPQANSSTFRSGWFVDVQNRGAGTLTVTPTTSTIDGAASLSIATNQGARIISNGANYFTIRGGAGVNAGSIAVTSNTLKGDGAGNAVGVSGTATDCVFVNGTSGTCGTGTVTTTGSPTSGNLTKFSGATSITNGDLSGDCSTSGALTVSCTGISATNITTGTLPCAQLPTGAPCRIGHSALSGTAATVTFSSISGSYTHLRLVIQARCDLSATNSDAYLQFNGDTNSNYSRQYDFGNNGTPVAGQTISAAKVGYFTVACATSIARSTGVAVIDIPNYSASTFSKMSITNSEFIAGATLSGNLFSGTILGYWDNTTPAAITSIVIGLTGAGNFISGSLFDLYAY